MQGQPDTAVTFTYHSGLANVVFSAGKAPRRAQSATVDLHNGWTITTVGSLPSRGLLGNDQALELLLSGAIVAFLIGIVMFVLGTGWARALRMVDEKAGELHDRAFHDDLTGLPNRPLILDRIDRLLARDRRSGTVGAAMYVDLDGFSVINDAMGREIGDRLLVAVAERMKTAVPDADTIGRMASDQFVVLLDKSSLDDGGPEVVAERLLAAMREPFELFGTAMPLMVTVSIGIAVGDRPSAGKLLRDADAALEEAKAAGKNGYAVFRPDMPTGISRRIELEFELSLALEGDEFRLFYQPIYDLDDMTLIGAEALLRWERPSQGLVQPDEFIPILEETGQIREVGAWVLRQACEQIAVWRDQGHMLSLSVNVSGRQLDDDAVLDHIRDALETSGLAPSALMIEVTETVLVRNMSAAAGRLRAIKALGIGIAIDDFGTGYSSLAYLQHLPVDCLKIDRSFVNGIASSAESRALIGTLAQLGRDLGLRTLAEGIETTNELDHLRAEHVDEAQGFLLARPLDVQTFEETLLGESLAGVGTARSSES